MGLLRLAVGKPAKTFARGLSTLQKSQAGKNSLLSPVTGSTGRRFMGGHGPDISKLEAALYIIIGGGGFAAFGIYNTVKMRERIEAFESGKVLPFKSLTDDEFLAFREKFQKLHSEEDEEEEGGDSEETHEGSAVDPEPEEDTSPVKGIAKSSKDTVIFIEPPKE